MVFLGCSTSNQQTTLWRTQESWRQHENQVFRKSRLSIEDLEHWDQAYTLLALLCKDEACACVRSAEDGNGHQAWHALLGARTARNATNFLNQLLEPTFTSPDPRINLRQWNKKCWGVHNTNRWTRKWWYPEGSLHEWNCTTRHATAFDVESVPSEHGWRGCPGNRSLLGCNRGIFGWWQRSSWIHCSSW